MPSTRSTRGVAAGKPHIHTQTTTKLNGRDIRSFVTRATEADNETADVCRKRKHSAMDQPIEATRRTKRIRSATESNPCSTPSKMQATAGQQECFPTPKASPPRSTAFKSSATKSQTPAKPTRALKEVYATPPRTPSKASPDPNLHEPSTSIVPIELDNLIQLNKAFLKTISLHIAHFGTTSPTDIRNLTPSISKTWGNRNVTLEDIRRNLGILYLSLGDIPDTDPEFSIKLYDYGRGSVCLEIIPHSHGRFVGTLLVNEHRLSELFISNLQQLWQDYLATSESALNDEAAATSQFTNELPLALISLHPSALASQTPSSRAMSKTPIKPTLGQSRLTQLYAVTKPEPSKDAKSSTAAHPPLDEPEISKSSKPNLQSRKSSLAQRLMQKSQAKAAAPQPSPEDTARRAAIQRLPEIVSIISADAFKSAKPTQDNSDIIGTVQSQRKTYNFTALRLKIQESARGILAKDEVQRCLEILHQEHLAGQDFVRIISIGGRDKGTVVGVVVDVSKRISLADLTSRVAQLLEAPM